MKIVRWNTTRRHPRCHRQQVLRPVAGRPLRRRDAGPPRVRHPAELAKGDRVKLLLLTKSDRDVHRWLTAPLVSVVVSDDLDLASSHEEQLVAHWALNWQDAALAAHPSTRMEG